MDVSAEQIAQVLTAAGRPLKVAEITKLLAEGKVITARELVNKVLYRETSRFAKTGDEGTPTWKLLPPAAPTRPPNHTRVVVDGVGDFLLDDRLIDKQTDQIIIGLGGAVAAAKDAEKWSCIARIEDTPLGRRIAADEKWDSYEIRVVVGDGSQSAASATAPERPGPDTSAGADDVAVGAQW